MSHQTEIRTRLRNLAALKAACRELGVVFTDKVKPRGWTGFVEGCAYTIQLEGRHDVCVRRQKDGTYTLQGDYYGGGIERQLGPKCGLLLQAYTKHNVAMVAAQHGWKVGAVKRAANNQIQMELFR